jgi:DNA-binding beta-propeller fold protein YncE
MRFARSFVWLAVLAIVMSSCAIDAAELPATPAPTAVPSEVAVVTPAPSATATPAAIPTAPSYGKLRVFVASENTEQVWVLEGAPKEKFALVAKIPVGKLPHQMAVSPDGKYVAVNNRLGDSTSIIDPIAMKEIVRIKVGKQWFHDIISGALIKPATVCWNTQQARIVILLLVLAKHP